LIYITDYSGCRKVLWKWKRKVLGESLANWNLLRENGQILGRGTRVQAAWFKTSELKPGCKIPGKGSGYKPGYKLPGSRRVSNQGTSNPVKHSG
jgi:hypothetical protein